MSETEEPDYLSDTFLKPCANDVRPGLVFDRKVKRKYEAEAKQAEANKRSYIKPRRVLEDERRTEGLNSAISSENKGFALLSKMGYKPGMAIGKQSTSSTEGIKEPIPLIVRADRSGLGTETAIKEKLNQLKLEMARMRERSGPQAQQDFRQRMRSKVVVKQIYGDLHRSQRICELLDKKKDVEEPSENWFWPKAPSDDEKDSSEECDEEPCQDDLEPPEKLAVITCYLRSFHFYCIWCATEYTDADDMAENCPGDTRDDH